MPSKCYSCPQWLKIGEKLLQKYEKPHCSTKLTIPLPFSYCGAFNTYRLGSISHFYRLEKGNIMPPLSILETIIDRDILFGSGSSCVFVEKLLFLVMSVKLLLSRFLEAICQILKQL